MGEDHDNYLFEGLKHYSYQYPFLKRIIAGRLERDFTRYMWTARFLMSHIGRLNEKLHYILPKEFDIFGDIDPIDISTLASAIWINDSELAKAQISWVEEGYDEYEIFKLYQCVSSNSSQSPFRIVVYEEFSVCLIKEALRSTSKILIRSSDRKHLLKSENDFSSHYRSNIEFDAEDILYHLSCHAFSKDKLAESIKLFATLVELLGILEELEKENTELEILAPSLKQAEKKYEELLILNINPETAIISEDDIDYLSEEIGNISSFIEEIKNNDEG